MSWLCNMHFIRKEVCVVSKDIMYKCCFVNEKRKRKTGVSVWTVLGKCKDYRNGAVGHQARRNYDNFRCLCQKCQIPDWLNSERNGNAEIWILLRLKYNGPI